ncbi:serine/threonine protein kinase [Leptolyngbya sp. 'hensonii']|uniref:protein kinase domain-containing protein n=1 Tax=Leptolyngbya sp. 'hensonii' TaxID=1922337 RepID=UPI00094F8D48|nr:protein kinase [Leptolyngbya sp. 'hensonii']OLP16799.1 serine/threonine protein kinase [Leptolyngbya sp. 'hensonii']
MLQPKQVLHDRYRLCHKLGQNAGRQTWLAEDLQAKPTESVIIKLLTFGGDVQWEDLKLFEREAQVLQQLQHPAIPHYRDYFSIDDRSLWFGMVQDYIPGQSLKDLLHQGKRFTEPEIQKIAGEVLEILIYLHGFSPPVLHRDLKPSNLIWGEDDRIYLVDFGAVHDRGVAEGATFTVVGTYGYAPVEQFGGRTVPASDLYALGATLIHLLTGISPADLPQRNLQIQFADRISVSPALVPWLHKMTEPALEKRFARADQALTTLRSGEMLVTVEPQLQETALENTSGQGGLFNSKVPVPPEVHGWNWGAFLLTPYWSLTNRVWLGLLVWLFSSGSWWVFRAFLHGNSFKAVLLINLGLEFGFMVLLGMKGNTWAWKSTDWRSIAQFKKHQRQWAIAGLMIGIPLLWLGWWQRIWLLLYFLR